MRKAWWKAGWVGTKRAKNSVKKCSVMNKYVIYLLWGISDLVSYISNTIVC